MSVATKPEASNTETTNPTTEKIMAFYAYIQALWKLTDLKLRGAEEWILGWDSWVDFDESTAPGYAAAQVQTVIQGVVVVVVASVGVVIVDNIDSALGNASNDNLNTSQDNLLTGFGSMIDLIEPLLIVLIAVVVIAVVQRIQQ